MRNFYLFQINDSIAKMTKDVPYELFKSLEQIYFRATEEVSISYGFASQIIKPINAKTLDIHIFKNYRDNYFYMKYKNTHSMHDFYRGENTLLKIFKSYLFMQTNAVIPKFFNELVTIPNLFVCDFDSKDYFWFDSLSINSIKKDVLYI